MNGHVLLLCISDGRVGNGKDTPWCRRKRIVSDGHVAKIGTSNNTNTNNSKKPVTQANSIDRVAGF